MMLRTSFEWCNALQDTQNKYVNEQTLEQE